jgi:hypothetical protein
MFEHNTKVKIFRLASSHLTSHWSPRTGLQRRTFLFYTSCIRLVFSCSGISFLYKPAFTAALRGVEQGIINESQSNDTLLYCLLVFYVSLFKLSVAYPIPTIYESVGYGAIDMLCLGYYFDLLRAEHTTLIPCSR